MSLTNAQYDSIMHKYDELRRERHMLIEKRKKEIYEKLPEYRDIEREISSLSVRSAIGALSGNANKDVAEQLESLHVKKNLILTNAGYSINYLEPPYTCPLCKDTGYVGATICSCFRQAILDKAYEQTTIKNLLEEENFDAISYEYQIGEDLTRFQKAESAARHFTDSFGEEYNNLMFRGSVGTGKSFLSNCIANEILKKGYSVIYFSAISLFENISSYKFGKTQRDFQYNPLTDIYSCDLLIIDDLGSEMSNQFVCSELFAIINERHLRKKSTVISTNLTLQELNDRYSSRIFSRIYKDYEICTLSGNDIRLYIKRNENRK